jgi:hypothetical protein
VIARDVGEFSVLADWTAEEFTAHAVAPCCDFPIAGRKRTVKDGAAQWLEVVRVQTREELPLVLLVLGGGVWFVEDERTGDILADTRP